MGPKPNDRCPCKKRRGHRDTEERQPGDDDGRDKVLRPQAQEHRGLTAATSAGTQAWSLPLSLSGTSATDTLSSDFWPPDLETRNTCCFKPRLWLFVTAALRHMGERESEKAHLPELE